MRLPECSFDDFVRLLTCAVTPEWPSAVEVAREHLGFSFEDLVRTSSLIPDYGRAIWRQAPHQERTKVIREAVALARKLNISGGVLFDQEMGSGEGWVLRTIDGVIWFAHTAGGYMPKVLGPLPSARTKVEAPEVAECTTAPEALAAAVKYILAELETECEPAALDPGSQP